MKKLFACFALLAGIHASAQQVLNIVPMPAEYSVGKGLTAIDEKTILVAKLAEEKKVAVLFNLYLQTLGLLPLKTATASKDNYIQFSIDKKNTKKESYRLDVQNNKISVVAADAAGLYYAYQTLIQLLPIKNDAEKKINYPLPISKLSITDYPRFEYRGMHLDVSRHFSPVSYIKKYIDYLAFHKLNNFHWHLTDDQGWRIEIKKYPLLTKVGGYRAQTLVGAYGSDVYDGKRYGGYYTQAEIKEVVKYAAERHVNVIPEIEMPGHALAALTAYPFLGCTKGPYKVAETWGVFDDVFCAGNDSTFTFIQNVLNEVMALFPSKLIHIGGDESPKVRWKECTACQARLKKEKLKDEHELQSYFIQRVEKYLNSKGRNIIGWDEILEGGLAPNATVMSWRGEEGGITAAKQQHNVIMTPGGWMYFDHSQSSNEDSVTFGGFTSVEKVYRYEPIPAELNVAEAKYILGAQANLWREYISNNKKTEYMLFPRMSALSEVLWTPKENRSWSNFEERLPTIFARYKSWGASFSNAFYDIQSKVIPLPGNGIGWELKSKNSDGNIVYGATDNQASYSKPIVVNETIQLSARLLNKQKEPLSNTITQLFYINKASGKPVSLASQPSKSYEGSGGFTLVDGVQNTMGMSRSSQFLGFSGTDLEATIDLGSIQSVNRITLHAFEQAGSWIYRPQFVAFYSSDDGNKFTLIDTAINLEEKRNLSYNSQKSTRARFIKVIAKNAGIIADGKPGAGSKPWLFVDEIEVK